jgi:pimeloyl-ACP methyl ester carboxylesterase
MTSRSTHLILVPGLGCTEELFAEQIASLRGDIAISVADHTRHDTISGIAGAVLAAAPSRFALCDLSMGGYIAFEIMRQAPRSSSCRRCITAMIAPLSLSLRRETSEPPYQSITRFLAVSDCAACLVNRCMPTARGDLIPAARARGRPLSAAGGTSAASGKTIVSLSVRRPKKRGPFQFVPVMARAMVERLA